jgi:hypothetical protein
MLSRFEKPLGSKPRITTSRLRSAHGHGRSPLMECPSGDAAVGARRRTGTQESIGKTPRRSTEVNIFMEPS